MQFGMPLTPLVKRLIIINLACWIGLVLILQTWVLKQPLIFDWFGLIPEALILDFWVWQPFTYMFVHSQNIFHVLFNMLVLWWFGSDLEMRWGGRAFLAYYLSCGIGAGLIYVVGLLIYYFGTGNVLPLKAPVVGASGAVFGLMLAYGLLFGERVIYFMMMFPMKAKFFVLIIGGIEVLNLLNSGVSSQTANLAHLGGLAAGFIYLRTWAWWAARKSPGQRRGRKLKLVVNNEDQDSNNPRFWN